MMIKIINSSSAPEKIGKYLLFCDTGYGCHTGNGTHHSPIKFLLHNNLQLDFGCLGNDIARSSSNDNTYRYLAICLNALRAKNVKAYRPPLGRDQAIEIYVNNIVINT